MLNEGEELACSAYYEAVGHFEAAFHIENQIQQSFDNLNHYYDNDKFRQHNYRFLLRCNVIHYIDNAYEQLLRSIIYSTGQGITKEDRSKIWGHKLEDKISHIPKSVIAKFDTQIIFNIDNMVKKPETEKKRQILKENVNKFGSLSDLVSFFEMHKENGEVRYRYEDFADGKEILAIGSQNIMTIFLVILIILNIQSKELWRKYPSYIDMRKLLPHLARIIHKKGSFPNQVIVLY